jgi:hypothetical protein
MGSFVIGLMTSKDFPSEPVRQAPPIRKGRGPFSIHFGSFLTTGSRLRWTAR